jgi:hypothetical protein
VGLHHQLTSTATEVAHLVTIPLSLSSTAGAGVGGGQRRHAADPLSDSLEAVLSTLGLQDYVAEVGHHEASPSDCVLLLQPLVLPIVTYSTCEGLLERGESSWRLDVHDTRGGVNA